MSVISNHAFELPKEVLEVPKLEVPKLEVPKQVVTIAKDPLAHVFTFLTLPELVNVARVSRAWNEAFMDNAVWKPRLNWPEIDALVVEKDINTCHYFRKW